MRPTTTARFAALLTSSALVAVGAPWSGTPAAAAIATSSVLAVRSAGTPLGDRGSFSLVFTNGTGKNVGVGSNTDGRVSIIGNDSTGGSSTSWSVSFPRKTVVGTYLFDPNSSSVPSWTADTRCFTGPGTAKAVVHDAAWTAAGVPTRLSISLTFPCAMDGGPGTTNAELRYQEPTTLGVGETVSAVDAPRGIMTVGRAVTMTRTFTNTGTAPAVMGAAFVAGESNPKYPSYVVATDGCKGKTLVPGADCTVSVTFDAPVHSNPTASLFVPDGRPQPSGAYLQGSAAPEPDQPIFVRVAGSLGSAVVNFGTPGASTTNGAYDGFEVLPRATDGRLGAVVATSGPSAGPYSDWRSVVIGGLPDRTTVSYVVRAILPGGARGPVSWYDTDSTVGRLLVAAGSGGVSVRGLDLLGHSFIRTGQSYLTYRRIVASPDRSTLALGEASAAGPGYSCSLQVMPLTDLSLPTTLRRTFGNACDDFPTFTSNGTIVFSHVEDGSQPATSTPSLQSYDVATGTVTPVVGGAGLTMPAAAPDGTVVAVDPVAQDLVRITPGVDAAPVVIAGTSGASNPAVDPATGRVAFIQKVGNSERVTLVNADGTGGATWLTTADMFASSPSWDGNRVYFSAGFTVWHATLPAGTLTQDTSSTGDVETRTTPLVLDVPDTTAPTVTTSTPPFYSKAATIPVTVTATDPGPAGSGVVSYDGQTASSSSGPWTTPVGWSGRATPTFTLPVSNGQVSCLRADATDASGNTSDWSTPVCVTGDTTLPTLKSLSIPAVYATTGKLGVAPSYSDTGSGVASVSFRYRRAAVSSTAFGAFTTGHLTTTPLTTAMPAGYEYCASFSATDRAGNTSAWSPERCAVAALEDRSLAVSSASARLTSGDFHASNATQLKVAGAQLTLASVSGRQVGVVVRTCATCGSLDVYVGSTHVGRISTRSTTTRNQVLLWLPRQSVTRTGKLVMRQTDMHGVYVDAVVVQHV